MVHKIPAGKKRQFSQSIKTDLMPRVNPPDDQSFADGVSIEMDTFGLDIQSGKRTRQVSHVVGRFPATERGCENLAAFFEQNCNENHLVDLNGKKN